MSGFVGRLRAHLGLDSTEFTRGVQGAQAQTQTLGRAMQRMGAVMSAMGAGVALAIRGQVQAADDAAKAADRLGLSVETYSRLSHAAGMSGGTVEMLTGALRRMSEVMANDAGRFAALGIAVRDATGAMRPTIDVLQDVADRIAEMPVGAERTAMAMGLMGEAGAGLIPMLRGGSAGLRAMMDEADRLGLTLSESTARAAEQFNDNLSRLGAVVSGLTRQIAAALLPVMAQITDALVAAAQGFARISPGMQTALASFAAVAVGIGPVVLAVGTLIRSLGLLRVALTLAAGPWGVLAALISAAAGYFLLFRDNASPAQSAAEETAAAMDALNTAMGTFYTSASPQTAANAVTAANALRQQAAAARDAAASQLALARAEMEVSAARYNASSDPESALLTGGQMDPHVAEFNRRLRELADAQTALDAADRQADRAVRAVTGAMSEQITTTGELAATTVSLNVALAATGVSAGGAAAEIDEVTTAAEDAQSRVQGAAQTLTGLFMAATRGADAARQALAQLLSRAAEALMNQAFMRLLGGGGGSGGGGLFSGLLRGLASFDGGGFTGLGARVGGLDGRGGMLALVHPNETVIDHTRGQSGGASTVRIELGLPEGLSVSQQQQVVQISSGITLRVATAQRKGLAGQINAIDARGV